MARCLEGLRGAGADFGLIATNTMHIVLDAVRKSVGMPLLSIVDATADAVLAKGIGKVGLLGTVFTMREAFYRDGLAARGVEAITPAEPDQLTINAVIYDELCRGEIRDESRQVFLEIIDGLRDRGAAGIVLGCTEIPLLVRPRDIEIPLFNTSIVHADKALKYAIGAG
jgi:aspartate racemase